MDTIFALKVNDQDNVATVFAQVHAGDTIAVKDKKGGLEHLSALDSFPYGHKIALADINPGAPIIKYGEILGDATAQIRRGAHVHVHNLASRRGRGDLE